MKKALLCTLLLLTFSVYGNEWTDGEQDAFMQSCMASSGGAYSACNCTLQWLMERFGSDELKKIKKADVEEAVAVCVRKERK